MVLLPVLSASARVRHNDAWARQRFANAERMREALNGRPAKDRTRREYQRVISLPIYSKMSDADVQDVIDAVCEVVELSRVKSKVYSVPASVTG